MHQISIVLGCVTELDRLTILSRKNAVKQKKRIALEFALDLQFTTTTQLVVETPHFSIVQEDVMEQKQLTTLFPTYVVKTMKRIVLEFALDLECTITLILAA